METAFRLYDEEEKGKITLENLKRVSQEVKLDIPESELIEMIKVADRNGDGEVTMDDFKRVMRKVGYLPVEAPPSEKPPAPENPPEQYQ